MLINFEAFWMQGSRFIRNYHMIYPNISRQSLIFVGIRFTLGMNCDLGCANTKVHKGCWQERSWLKAIYGICFSDQVPIFLVAPFAIYEFHPWDDPRTYWLSYFSDGEKPWNTKQILLFSAAFWIPRPRRQYARIREKAQAARWIRRVSRVKSFRVPMDPHVYIYVWIDDI